VLGARDDADLLAQVRQALTDAQAGRAPAPHGPTRRWGAPVRIAIDFADAADLATKLDKAVKALTSGNPAMEGCCASRVCSSGGPGPEGGVPLHRPGVAVRQHAAGLASEPIVDATFREADEVMTPLLGRPLSDVHLRRRRRPHRVAQLEQQLLQTEITQPAVLATDSSDQPTARRLRHAPRHGDGAQPRRVRRPRRRRLAHVRRRRSKR
jgi:hypothetical protein